MKIVAQGINWDQVKQALDAGGFANHSSWHAAGPAYVGPTALGVHAGKYVVVTDDGTVIHEWRPSPAEMASEDWQIVEIAAGEVKPAASARTAGVADGTNHQPRPERSPLADTGGGAGVTAGP